MHERGHGWIAFAAIVAPRPATGDMPVSSAQLVIAPLTRGPTRKLLPQSFG